MPPTYILFLIGLAATKGVIGNARIADREDTCDNQDETALLQGRVRIAEESPTPLSPSTPLGCCDDDCRTNSDCWKGGWGHGAKLFCCPQHHVCMGHDTSGPWGKDCDACKAAGGVSGQSDGPPPAPPSRPSPSPPAGACPAPPPPPNTPFEGCVVNMRTNKKGGKQCVNRGVDVQCASDSGNKGKRFAMWPSQKNNPSTFDVTSQPNGEVCATRTDQQDGTWTFGLALNCKCRKLAPTVGCDSCPVGQNVKVSFGKNLAGESVCVDTKKNIQCDSDAGNKGKRIADWPLQKTANDRFDIQVYGSTVCATRVDSKRNPWQFSLEINCKCIPAPPQSAVTPPAPPPTPAPCVAPPFTPPAYHGCVVNMRVNKKGGKLCLNRGYDVQCASDSGNKGKRFAMWGRQKWDPSTYDVTSQPNGEVCATRTDQPGKPWTFDLALKCKCRTLAPTAGCDPCAAGTNVKVSFGKNLAGESVCVDTKKKIECASDAGNKGKRVAQWPLQKNANDRFDIQVHGSTVCATRIDRKRNPWWFALEINCKCAA